MTASFTLAEILQPPGQEPVDRVAVDLCKAVELVSAAFVAKYPKNRLAVEELSADGTVAVLGPG